MKFIEVIKQDIRAGENLDIYINIVLAIVLIALSTFGVVNLTVIASAILAVLGLLLASLLVNRRESRKIRTLVSNFERADTLPEKFLSNKYDRHELAQALHTAHKVFFWGLDFATTLPSLRTDLQQGLEAGLEARFLLLEPNSEAGKMAILARPEQTLKEFNTAITSNLSYLSRLESNMPKGKLEFRTINYYPALNVTAFDPDLKTGWMLVRMVSFRERFPTFKLTRAQDEKWFDHIVQQFESLWKEAHAVQKPQR